jgi:carbamoyltransferase
MNHEVALVENLICGLRLTHDGCSAVVSEDELLFSIEAEKIGNRPRYSALNVVADLSAVLSANGIDPEDLTAIAVDGWFCHRGESRVMLVDAEGRIASWRRRSTTTSPVRTWTP